MRNIKRKFVAVILLFGILFAFFPSPTHAEEWGASMLAAMWKQTMEQIVKRMEDTMVAMLKTQGIQMVMGQLKGIMGGGGKGTGPIGNWKQFIYGTATQESKKVTSDFFKSQKQGTPAALTKRIVNPAEKAVAFDTDPEAYKKMKPDLQKYVREGRADMIFQPGWAQNPWVAWQKAAAPQNDLASIYMRGVITNEESFRRKEEEKKAEGIAGAGYQSKKAGGKAGGGEGTITTPGSSQKDLVTKITSMPMDRLAMANTLPDIVAAMVTQVLTQMLKQGLAMANQQIGGAMKGAGGMGGIGNIQNMIMRGVK